MGKASGWTEPFHEHLERHVLVLIGGQGAPTHLGQQLGHGRVLCQVNPQHQGVDEEPDQVSQRRVTAPSDRESHCYIAACADLGQQHGQRGLDDHEAGRVVFAGEIAHLLLQLRRPFHRHRGAALIGGRWVGPIGRQLQPLGQPRQRLPPVGQLFSDKAVAVFDVSQQCALPQRVVDVLYGQRRPIGRTPRASVCIGAAQIPHKRSD
nr:hypothetical protein CPGR_00653 [Mycolicibacterium malmesburyense]